MRDRLKDACLGVTIDPAYLEGLLAHQSSPYHLRTSMLCSYVRSGTLVMARNACAR